MKTWRSCVLARTGRAPRETSGPSTSPRSGCGNGRTRQCRGTRRRLLLQSLRDAERPERRRGREDVQLERLACHVRPRAFGARRRASPTSLLVSRTTGVPVAGRCCGSITSSASFTQATRPTGTSIVIRRPACSVPRAGRASQALSRHRAEGRARRQVGVRTSHRCCTSGDRVLGCCWVMQWMPPPREKIGRASTLTTRRPG